MERNDIIDRLYDITSDLEDLMSKVEKDDCYFDDSASSLTEWKNNVIKNLPKGSSLAFELKVQEFLDSIKGVE